MLIRRPSSEQAPSESHSGPSPADIQPTQRSLQEDRAFSRDLLLIVLLGLGAFALRAYRIGDQELWLDEVFSFRMVTDTVWMSTLLWRENSPPLYYLLLHVWILLFGDGEATIRLLSAFLGTGAVLAILWAGWELFNRRIGMWSGVFAAVSPLAIYYGQEARAYSLLLLGLGLTYALLWRAIRVNTRTAWAAASGAALVALFSHYLSVLALLPAATAVWFGPDDRLRRQRLTRFGWALAACVLAYAPWLLWAFVWSAHGHTASQLHWIQQAWEDTPPLAAVPRSLEVFALGSQAGLLPYFAKQFTTLHVPGWVRWLGVAVMGVVGLAAAASWGERELAIADVRRRKLWAWLVLIVPLSTLWMISLGLPIYLVGRYDLIAFPGYALLVGLALGKMQGLRRHGRVLMAAVIVAGALAIGVKLARYYGGRSPTWAEPTAQVLARVVAEGDVVVTTGLRGLPVYAYYLHRLGFAWEEGRCRHRVTGRHFACRMFPRYTEDALFDFRGSETSAETHAEVEALLDDRHAPGGTLWIAFAYSFWSDGRLIVSSPDDLLVEDLARRGFRPTPVGTSHVPGLFRFDLIDSDRRS